MTALPMPSPLAFTAQALEERGALVDHDEAGPYLLLPDPVARELNAPAELRLSERADDAGAVFCGLGSALLDQLTQALRKDSLVCSVALDLPAPRPAQASAMAARLGLRNAVHEVVDAGLLDATYVALVASWVAEADDRHEGLVVSAACASDGAEPDAALVALLDPTQWTADALPAAAPPPEPDGALRWIAARVDRVVRQQHLPPVLEALGRRKQRDHERIEAYFGELIDEARLTRRKIDPSAIEAKVAALLAERTTKLRDLDGRYGLRVRVSAAALVVAQVPTAVVRVLARRRKDSRELLLRLPARAASLDQLACEGCLGATARPALCDGRLHVLCEECVPQAQGRFSCPRCAQR